jgi:hypothetical protein
MTVVSFWSSSIFQNVIPRNDSSWKVRGRSYTELVSKRGVPRPWLNFSPKTYWWKALRVRARCHGEGSTCRGTILASQDEPALSDVPNLGDNASDWQSGQLELIIGAFSVQGIINSVMTSDFDIPALWRKVGLEIFIPCSTTLSQGQSRNPNFHPHWCANFPPALLFVVRWYSSTPSSH